MNFRLIFYSCYEDQKTLELFILDLAKYVDFVLYKFKIKTLKYIQLLQFRFKSAFRHLNKCPVFQIIKHLQLPSSSIEDMEQGTGINFKIGDIKKILTVFVSTYGICRKKM